MNTTAIEWTDFSANPMKFRDANGKVVWGCVHASPGCVNCYAETLAHRYDKGGPFNVQTMANLTPFLDELELRKMLTYKPASGKRCFVGDMTDIFGEWVPDALLDQLFAVFALRRDVTWQLLTKRAERMRRYFEGFLDSAGKLDEPAHFARICETAYAEDAAWPPANVWLGVSCEDQQRADERIPHLLKTPAAVRFISAEPLLGPINTETEFLDWVIVGGESGPGARPCRLEWVFQLVNECVNSEVPCFVKQFGAKPSYQCGQCGRNIGRGFYGGYVDACGPTHAALILELQRIGSHKGNNMAEWPEDLRVRQFPLGSVRP